MKAKESFHCLKCLLFTKKNDNYSLVFTLFFFSLSLSLPSRYKKKIINWVSFFIIFFPPSLFFVFSQWLLGKSKMNVGQFKRL